jgi:hypothetical protein
MHVAVYEIKEDKVAIGKILCVLIQSLGNQPLPKPLLAAVLDLGQ